MATTADEPELQDDPDDNGGVEIRDAREIRRSDDEGRFIIEELEDQAAEERRAAVARPDMVEGAAARPELPFRSDMGMEGRASTTRAMSMSPLHDPGRGDLGAPERTDPQGEEARRSENPAPSPPGPAASL